MAFTPAAFADGQLPNADAALYTATVACLARISVVNVDTTARTVNILVKRAAGTARNVSGLNYSMAAGGGAKWYPAHGFVFLAVGDAIRGYADVANKVDYVIDGGSV